MITLSVKLARLSQCISFFMINTVYQAYNYITGHNEYSNIEI